jgi:hypothetical protein
MGIMKGLSRLGVLLTSLGVIAVAFAGTAPASMAMVPRPGAPAGADGTGAATAPATVVRTVVVGGTPGWQIALIVIAAALVAAVAAVLLDRTREARRRLVNTPA